MPNLLPMEFEMAILFSMKHDQYPPLPPSVNNQLVCLRPFEILNLSATMETTGLSVIIIVLPL